MIIYNMRFRGPYEYDKTILNVFQYNNLVLRLAKEMQDKDCKLSELENGIDKANKKMEAVLDQMMAYKEAAEKR